MEAETHTAVGAESDNGSEAGPSADYIPSRNRRVSSILPSKAFFKPQKPPPLGKRARERLHTPQTVGAREASTGLTDDDEGFEGGGTEVESPVSAYRPDDTEPGHAASKEERKQLRSVTSTEPLMRTPAGGHGTQGPGAIRASRAGNDPLVDVIARVQGGDMKLQGQSAVMKPTRASAALNGVAAPDSRGLYPETITRRQRKYKQWKGGNRFFLAGRIITSEASPFPFIASLALAWVLPGLWFGFDAPYVAQKVSLAPVILLGYMVAVALTSMFVTAWRDPGIILRDLDPDPPCASPDGQSRMDRSDPLAVPLPRVIRVRGTRDVKVKWCETCGTYRPPRSSHCRMCDNCVENIDHHCTFLNTCIGRRNYTSFFAFLIFTLLSLGMMIAFSLVHLYCLTRPTTQRLPRSGAFGSGLDFRGALAESPMSAVLFILNVSAMAPICVLFGYHVRLIALNRTTVEQIKVNTDREFGVNKGEVQGNEMRRCLVLPKRSTRAQPNPFAFNSIPRDCFAVLCKPVNLSWIERYAMEEVVIEKSGGSEAIEMARR